MLVTGGGSGIGRASHWLSHAKGAKVVVADISTAGGEEAMQHMEDSENVD